MKTPPCILNHVSFIRFHDSIARVRDSGTATQERPPFGSWPTTVYGCFSFDTPPPYTVFFVRLDICIYVSTGKNLTKTLHTLEIGRNMDKADSYYGRNQDARKDYQRQYYLNNKDRIMSKRRVEELADPEKFEQRKDYNKSYYLKNKERILKRRAEVYAAKVASRRK
jgi:hypothetical protein